MLVARATSSPIRSSMRLSTPGSGEADQITSAAWSTTRSEKSLLTFKGTGFLAELICAGYFEAFWNIPQGGYRAGAKLQALRMEHVTRLENASHVPAHSGWMRAVWTIFANFASSLLI